MKDINKSMFDLFKMKAESVSAEVVRFTDQTSALAFIEIGRAHV